MVSAGSVLVVCTGNVCRSPYIERRLRHELAGTGIEVTSAGTRALVGRDMDAGSRDILQRSGVDADGWWATGDVGFLDPDGDLFLVDRVKELIIVSGFNVYPTEVEEVVREVTGVREAAVIGVPDEETGEAVVAYVRPDEGADADEVEAAVVAHCDVRLARFKRPQRIEVVDELPLTVTGKVRKGTLRASERRRRNDLMT